MAIKYFICFFVTLVLYIIKISGLRGEWVSPVQSMDVIRVLFQHKYITNKIDNYLNLDTCIPYHLSIVFSFIYINKTVVKWRSVVLWSKLVHFMHGLWLFGLIGAMPIMYLFGWRKVQASNLKCHKCLKHVDVRVKSFYACI